MNTYKIFLASSYELKIDRDQFEIFINRQNKEWIDKGIFLELDVWEDSVLYMSPSRMQDRFNETIRDCDIFVLLFSSKVGEFTKEEFEIAYDSFQKTKKPIIYIFFKKIALPIDQINREDQKTLWSFLDRLKELNHFQTIYESSNDLILYFSEQLDKLISTGFIQSSGLIPPFQKQTFTPSTQNTFPHTLTLPPFKPEFFLGREDDLSAINNLLYLQNMNLLLITGEAGLGKTSLASEYYHANQEKYYHVAWVFRGNNIREALVSNLSRSLNVQYEELMPIENRLDKLLIAMNALPKPSLLVIDDADNPDDIEEIYLSLLRCTNFHIILTTRISKFRSAYCYPLQNLSEKKALELFCKYYPYHNASENNLFFQIRDAVGGNTLVIEILAKNLAILNQNENTYTLSHLIEDIQKKGFLNITESDPLEITYHAMKNVKPLDIITAMYDLSNLSSEEATVLSVFSVLPSEKMEFKDCTMFFDLSVNLRNILRILSQKGWIEFNQELRTYKCSPLIQEIIKKKNADLYEDCQFLIDTLSKKLEYDYKTGHPLRVSLEEASRLVRFGESVVRNLFVKNESDITLCENIGMYFKVTGDISKANQYFTLTNQVGKKLLEKDLNNEKIKNKYAISLKKLGDIEKSLGNNSKALEYYQQYNQLESELSKEYPLEISYQIEFITSYDRLGHIFLSQNDLNKALEHFTQSFEISKDLLTKYPEDKKIKTCHAIANQKIGNLYQSLGNLDKAIYYCTQFMLLEKELCLCNPQDFGYQYALCVAYGTIGRIYLYMNDFSKTIEYLTLYNQMIDDLYKAYPQNIGLKFELAVSLHHFGDMYEEKEDLPKALDYYLKSNQIMRELFENYSLDVRIKNGFAETCLSVGMVYHSMKEFDKALVFLSECNRFEKELVDGNPDDSVFKNSYASALLCIGDVYGEKNEIDKALSSYQQSKEINQKLLEFNPNNVNFKNSLALSYEKLGIFYKDKMNDTGLSASHFNKAMQLWDELVRDAPGYMVYKHNLTRIKSKLDNSSS